jgi:hypothetical protein
LTRFDAGLRFLQSELTKLSTIHPDEAERLKIPGSVEAITNRLHARTIGT